MTYIIGENCIDVLDGACVDVCPVDCIYSKPGDRQLFINPEECIDCAACEPVCPVTAIYPEEEVPEDQKEFIKLNYEYDYDSSEPGLNTSRMKPSTITLRGKESVTELTILKPCGNPDCKGHGTGEAHGHGSAERPISWTGTAQPGN